MLLLHELTLLQVWTLATHYGYKILEISAATDRSGRHVLDMIGEATQSHQISCVRTSDDASDLLPPAEPQFNNNTLVIFEDVDVSFEGLQDRGFFHALRTLLRNTKTPIVLICNGTSPVASVVVMTFLFQRLQQGLANLSRTWRCVPLQAMAPPTCQLRQRIFNI